MPISKQWPSGGTNPVVTSYNIPLNNELNWTQLSSFLQALADSAQGTSFQKFAARVAVTTPIAVSATTDCVVVSNLTVAGPVAVTLPAGAAKQVFIIVDGKGDAATNNITITPNGAETIRGAATLVLANNYTGVILVFTGTDWNVFGPFLAPGQVTPADFVGILPTTKGGTGVNGTATFPSAGIVAVVPAAGVVKSNATVLSVSNVDLTSEVTGALPIANGGTGQTTAILGFNALSPLTTKGDIVTNDGTNDVRKAVGTNGQVLSANSAQADGLEWISPLTNPMDSEGDLIVGGVAGAATKLDSGATGQLLMALGAASPSWVDTVTTLKTFNQGVANPIAIATNLTISTAIGVMLVNPTINVGQTWTLNNASAHLAVLNDVIVNGDLIVTDGTVRAI
jgi:hypothetical protein